MNIGVLSTSLPSSTTGGAEEQASKIASLLARNHDVTVFTRSRWVADAPEPGQSYRVCQRSPVGIRGLRFPADIVGTLVAIGRRRRSLDVLIAYQAVIDGLLGVIAKKLFDIPVVVSVRSEREYVLERDLMARWFSPFVFRHADTVLVQTKTIREELLDALADAGYEELSRNVSSKVAVIPNGVTLREYGPVRGKDVLFVGRLIEAKGVRYLVEAMRRCPEEHLVVVGSGPEMPQLQRAAEGCKNISFAGRVRHEDLDAYFRRAKLIVVPSLRDEGMPNVIMEAMSRGIPVVASRNAGIPDLVDHGKTGLLVEPGDAEAIVRSVRRLSNDESLQERLSLGGWREVRQYDWPYVVGSLEQELQKLASRQTEAVN